MSRRKRRPAAAPTTGRAGRGRSSEAGTAATRAAPGAAGAPSSEPRASRRVALDLGILAAVVGATVGIAELAGAANLGVAFGIGQVAFAIALLVLLLRA